MTKFIMISKDDCPWCEKAKDLITQKGGQYAERNIGDPLFGTEYKRVLKENRLTTVPQIWYDEVYIGGYTDLEKWYNG